MRLLNTTILKLEEFVATEGIKYAILSHRWEDEEVSLQQFVAGDAHGKLGYIKIQRFCELAAKNGHQYAWADTCCIDKTSSAELQEAINSMYRWYEEAAVCYVYLSDVDSLEDLDKSAWFTRGWTLQELIAPESATFYNCRWESIGTKTSLAEALSGISGVPVELLKGATAKIGRSAIRNRHVLERWSVAQRMSWASKRVTTRTEDTAYCLMALFDVNMPMLYGEGHKACRRLQEEIIRTSDDHSIFAWSCEGDGPRDLLASSPTCFEDCANTVSDKVLQKPGITPEQFSLTNVGLSISLPMKRWNMTTYLAVLDCRAEAPYALSHCTGIFLARTPRTGQVFRTSSMAKDIYHLDDSYWLNPVWAECEKHKILIVSRPGGQHMMDSYHHRINHGFDFSLTSNPLFGATANGKVDFRLSGYTSLNTNLFEPWHLWRATFADGQQWMMMDFMIPENTGPLVESFLVLLSTSAPSVYS